MTSHPVNEPVVLDADVEDWEINSAGSWDERSALVSILTADIPGDDELIFQERYGSHPAKLPPRAGFVASDMLSGSQEFFDRIITLPRWNIAFAAFAIHGFYVHQDDAAAAFERLIPLQWTHPLVARLVESATRLTILSGNTGSIDPGVILSALPAASASPPLVRLLWASRKQIGDDLVRIRTDVDDRLRKLDQEIEAQSRAITSLYILAASIDLPLLAKTLEASTKARDDPNPEPVAAHIYRVLEITRGQLAITSTSTWQTPSERTIKRWLRVASTTLAIVEKNKVGRPPKRRSPARVK